MIAGLTVSTRPPSSMSAPALTFIPRTAARLDGGLRAVFVLDEQAPARVPIRVVFHRSIIRKPWTCAVTGEMIPAGTAAWIPTLGGYGAIGSDPASASGALLAPFRVSLDGWQALETGRIPSDARSQKPDSPSCE